MRLKEMELEILKDQASKLDRAATDTLRQQAGPGSGWSGKLILVAKVLGIGILLLIAIRLATWLATMVVIGLALWLAYKAFFQQDQSDG